MLSCRELTKVFEDTVALDGVTMEIGKGSIYGLVGSNGAGKSTLMRLAAGVYEPDSGEISLFEQPIFENPEQKQRVFLVADDPYFLPQVTLDGMADFYKRFYPQFDCKLYESLCEMFALPRKKKIGGYSKGMKRQAAFLLGLSVRPDCLLLDECFDGLDPVKRQIVRKILCDSVAEQGMSVVISSHNLRELDEVCDTVGILHKGKLLYSKELDDLKGEVHKVQVVFDSEVTKEALKETLPVMSSDVRGKFYTLIIRGSMEEINQKLAPFAPVAMENFPLTLEEVFLYEMEVKGYDATVLFSEK